MAVASGNFEGRINMALEVQIRRHEDLRQRADEIAKGQAEWAIVSGRPSSEKANRVCDWLLHFGAGDQARTGDILVGNETFYH